jgi:excisionase family DNA binding protein
LSERGRGRRLDELLTFDEASEVLRLKPSTLHKIVSRREIQHVKTSGDPGSTGGRLLSREKDLQEWIERRLVTAGTTVVGRGRPRLRLDKAART